MFRLEDEHHGRSWESRKSESWIRRRWHDGGRETGRCCHVEGAGGRISRRAAGWKQSRIFARSSVSAEPYIEQVHIAIIVVAPQLRAGGGAVGRQGESILTSGKRARNRAIRGPGP